jgi:hypothetical protein
MAGFPKRPLDRDLQRFLEDFCNPLSSRAAPSASRRISAKIIVRRFDGRMRFVPEGQTSLAPKSLHALDDFCEGREMLFLTLLGDPVSDREHFTVACIREQKADRGRTPFFTVAVP